MGTHSERRLKENAMPRKRFKTTPLDALAKKETGILHTSMAVVSARLQKGNRNCRNRGKGGEEEREERERTCVLRLIIVFCSWFHWCILCFPPTSVALLAFRASAAHCSNPSAQSCQHAHNLPISSSTGRAQSQGWDPLFSSSHIAEIISLCTQVSNTPLSHLRVELAHWVVCCGRRRSPRELEEAHRVGPNKV